MLLFNARGCRGVAGVSEASVAGGMRRGSHQHFFDLVKWPEVRAACCERGQEGKKVGRMCIIRHRNTK